MLGRVNNNSVRSDFKQPIMFLERCAKKVNGLLRKSSTPVVTFQTKPIKSPESSILKGAEELFAVAMDCPNSDVKAEELNEKIDHLVKEIFSAANTLSVEKSTTLINRAIEIIKKSGKDKAGQFYTYASAQKGITISDVMLDGIESVHNVRKINGFSQRLQDEKIDQTLSSRAIRQFTCTQRERGVEKAIQEFEMNCKHIERMATISSETTEVVKAKTQVQKTLFFQFTKTLENAKNFDEVVEIYGQVNQLASNYPEMLESNFENFKSDVSKRFKQMLSSQFQDGLSSKGMVQAAQDLRDQVKTLEAMNFTDIKKDLLSQINEDQLNNASQKYIRDLLEQKGINCDAVVAFDLFMQSLTDDFSLPKRGGALLALSELRPVIEMLQQKESQELQNFDNLDTQNQEKIQKEKELNNTNNEIDSVRKEIDEVQKKMDQLFEKIISFYNSKKRLEEIRTVQIELGADPNVLSGLIKETEEKKESVENISSNIMSRETQIKNLKGQIELKKQSLEDQIQEKKRLEEEIFWLPDVSKELKQCEERLEDIQQQLPIYRASYQAIEQAIEDDNATNLDAESAAEDFEQISEGGKSFSLIEDLINLDAESATEDFEQTSEGDKSFSLIEDLVNLDAESATEDFEQTSEGDNSFSKINNSTQSEIDEADQALPAPSSKGRLVASINGAAQLAIGAWQAAYSFSYNTWSVLSNAAEQLGGMEDEDPSDRFSKPLSIPGNEDDSFFLNV